MGNCKSWYCKQDHQRKDDTIDALVAALQNFVDRDEYCREDYEEAQAALALARRGG